MKLRRGALYSARSGLDEAVGKLLGPLAITPHGRSENRRGPMLPGLIDWSFIDQLRASS